MRIGVFAKKSVALSATLAYVVLFNYCVVYAAVTGEGHPPATASTAELGDHGSHGHEHDAPSHDHAPSGETDPCCSTLTEGVPALPSSTRAVLRPFAPGTFIAVASDGPASFVLPGLPLIARAQGPPGPPGPSAFFQPSRPRAPPVLSGF
jgi:hypothetical protein